MGFGGFQESEDKQIVLIDITNACFRRCAGCMRLCNYRVHEWFADVDYLHEVFVNLIDFQGAVGLFGGEPLLHPAFLRIAADVRAVFGEHDHKHGVVDVDEISTITHGVGLWTTADQRVWRVYADVVRRSFAFLRINDHSVPSYHFPILVCPAELGYTKDEIDSLKPCWVSRCCARSITPWGAYFCEVAGALDGFLKFGLGKPPVRNWWKSDFSAQHVLCQFCGARLPLRHVTENTENVTSLMWSKWLRAAGSNESIKIVSEKPGRSAEKMREIIIKNVKDVHCSRVLYW